MSGGISDPNQGGRSEFGDFGYIERPYPKDRQKFFVDNLAYKLSQCQSLEDVCKKGAEYVELKGKIDSVFKVDERWNSESVGRLNIIMSQLCAMPKGRELINTLISLAVENNYQIKFVPENNNFTASLPRVEGGKGVMEVGIDWNILDKTASEFVRLTFDGKEYGIQKMKYPAFIIMAHELSHMVHSIENYKALREKYGDKCPAFPPNDSSQINENPTSQWQGFAQMVCKDKKCEQLYNEAIDRVKKEEDASKRCHIFQTLVNEACAAEKLRQTSNDNLLRYEFQKMLVVFGFTAGTFPYEELLNICGDSRFNDGIMLKNARENRLLYSGFDDNSPLFRLGFIHMMHLLGCMVEFATKIASIEKAILKYLIRASQH
ncbi:MAG: hypothetical protein LBI81_02960 [Puniceicoccales bacterium]|jgi:hypothetical protein|nr:hypothetical protein [Puniceicoccales bacterium]